MPPRKSSRRSSTSSSSNDGLPAAAAERGGRRSSRSSAPKYVVRGSSDEDDDNEEENERKLKRKASKKRRKSNNGGGSDNDSYHPQDEGDNQDQHSDDEGDGSLAPSSPEPEPDPEAVASPVDHEEDGAPKKTRAAKKGSNATPKAAVASVDGGEDGASKKKKATKKKATKKKAPKKGSTTNSSKEPQMVKQIRFYEYIENTPNIMKHVDKEALKTWAPTTSFCSHNDPTTPFYKVPHEEWEKMKEALNEKGEWRVMFQWACRMFHRGHPARDMKVGGFTLDKVQSFCFRLGARQEDHRNLLGMKPIAQREEPVPPNGIRDVFIPFLSGNDLTSSLAKVDLTHPDTDEDVKIAHALIKYVHSLRNDLSNERKKAASELKLGILRKLCGILVDVGRYSKYFVDELISLRKSGQFEGSTTMYAGAVFRDMAGVAVDSSLLEGFSAFEEMMSTYNEELASSNGKVINALVGFLFKSQVDVTLLALSDEWIEIVAAVLMEIRNGTSTPHWEEKIRRFMEEGERCMLGENCQFCARLQKLFLLIAELHHLGLEGARKKKELAKGKHPSDCNAEELKAQKNFMALLCTGGHRVMTVLETQDPQEKGHKSIPERFRCVPMKLEHPFRQSVRDGMNKLLLELESHNKSPISQDVEHFKQYSPYYDYHHPSETYDIQVLLDDEVISSISGGFKFDRIIFETGKTFNISDASHCVTSRDYPSQLPGLVSEVMVVRPLECDIHDVWHFLDTYSYHPQLNGLFAQYPFEMKDGMLTYTGKSSDLLKELNLSIEELMAACNEDGRVVLQRSEAFMKQVNYRKSVRSKSMKNIGRSTTAEDEDEDAKMAADDRKSEDVVSTVGSVVAAEAEDEDAKMAADDRKSEGVVSTVGSVVAAEAEDQDAKMAVDDGKRSEGVVSTVGSVEAKDEDAKMAVDDKNVSTVGSVAAEAGGKDEDDHDDEDVADDDFGDSPFGHEDDEEEELDVNDNGATDFEDFSENEVRLLMEALEYCEEHGYDPFTGNPIGEISAEEVNDTTRAFGEVDGTEYSYFQDIKSHDGNKHVGNQSFKGWKKFQPHPPKKR